MDIGGTIAMSKNKKKKIGEMTNSRILWERKPQTQVVPNKKSYTRKNKHKNENTGRRETHD